MLPWIKNKLGTKPFMCLLAIALCVVAASMTGEAGYEFGGWKWSIGMVIITIAAMLLPDEAVSAWLNRRYLGAACMAARCAACSWIGEFFGHLLVVSAARKGNVHVGRSADHQGRRRASHGRSAPQAVRRSPGHAREAEPLRLA